jgi:hypothetical protein
MAFPPFSRLNLELSAQKKAVTDNESLTIRPDQDLDRLHLLTLGIVFF